MALAPERASGIGPPVIVLDQYLLDPYGFIWAAGFRVSVTSS
jgi:hypothetical protein